VNNSIIQLFGILKLTKNATKYGSSLLKLELLKPGLNTWDTPNPVSRRIFTIFLLQPMKFCKITRGI